MDQAELEQQLKIWKDLAISKQVLIGAATDALGLDPDCGADVLKSTLDQAIKRSMEADANIENAQEQARVAVTVMEQKVADSGKQADEAKEAKETADTELEKIQQQMETARSANAEEIKKSRAAVAEKDRALKAINKALADTPENVLKKLGALKKQKADAARAQKQAETATRTIRKEKQNTQQKLNKSQDAARELATQYRDLHKLTTEIQEQLKPLLEDDAELPEVPELNEEFLEELEKAENKEDKEDK